MFCFCQGLESGLRGRVFLCQGHRELIGEMCASSLAARQRQTSVRSEQLDSSPREHAGSSLPKDARRIKVGLDREAHTPTNDTIAMTPAKRRAHTRYSCQNAMESGVSSTSTSWNLEMTLVQSLHEKLSTCLRTADEGGDEDTRSSVKGMKTKSVLWTVCVCVCVPGSLTGTR